MAQPNDSVAFSDTSNKNGLIQIIEKWTALGDGGISGNATLLKMFTASINDAFDELMPILLSYSDTLRWDDTNNTDLPIGKFNIVSGQSDYKTSTDANALNILNITEVMILPSATATNYVPVQRMTLDDYYAKYAMSPNITDVGVPGYFVEKGNTIFLFPQPNYAATNGCKIFFERDPSYFVSTDTTKKPGIPRPFHNLLAYIPALEYILINSPSSTTLITRLEAKIAKRETNLSALISERNPTHRKLEMAPINFR